MDCFESAACGQCYVCRMVEVFREVWRVLRDDGTLWLNLGDTFASSPKGNPGSLSKGLTNQGRRAAIANMHRTRSTIVGELKPKDLVGMPWRVAFALQADGWYLRSDIIWHKPSPMPESVMDRPTKSHEYLFLLTKSQRYYFGQDELRHEPTGITGGACVGKVDQDGPNARRMSQERNKKLRERGANRRDVWTINPAQFKGAHFAVMPEELARLCILGGCPEGGVVLDPFLGSGTTGKVAQQYGRDFIGIELSAEYLELARDRFKQSRLFG